MKNMSPEQMRAGLSQAQTHMGNQRQYMYNASVMLKNEGNVSLKAGKYEEALKDYKKAIDNIKDQSDKDAVTLRLQLLQNSSLCHLKQREYRTTIEVCEEALKIDPRSVKALFRRGQARHELGSLKEAFRDIRGASELSPDDKVLNEELEKLRNEMRDKGIMEEDVAPLDMAQPSGKPAAKQPLGSATGAGSSSSSMATTPGAPWANSDQMKQVAQQVAQNPDMLRQATE